MVIELGRIMFSIFSQYNFIFYLRSMHYYPSLDEIEKSNDEDDVAAEKVASERKAAEATEAERLAAAERSATELERKAAEAPAAGGTSTNMPAVPHMDLTEQPLLILQALLPATVVANAIKSFWDEENRVAKGDLAALHQFMKAQNVGGVTRILAFNLPEVFNGWARLTATYLIEYSHVFMNTTVLQDRGFIKKVGRVLVERALMTNIPDGPHARLDYTLHDRAIPETHRTWTADIIDYLFFKSEWPWMSRYVHGWNRDLISRSENENFVALQANIENKQGINLDHVIIPPPRLSPPASPVVRSSKRRRSVSTQTSSSSSTSSSSTSKTSSTSTTRSTTSATSGGTSCDDAIRAGCVLPTAAPTPIRLWTRCGQRLMNAQPARCAGPATALTPNVPSNAERRLASRAAATAQTRPPYDPSVPPALLPDFKVVVDMPGGFEHFVVVWVRSGASLRDFRRAVCSATGMEPDAQMWPWSGSDLPELTETLHSVGVSHGDTIALRIRLRGGTNSPAKPAYTPRK